MQTVYVPVSVADELPPISTTDKWNKREEISDYHFAKVVDRNGEAMQDSRAQYFYKGGSWSIQGYLGDFKVTHWLKPTEAVLLSKEDADRVKELEAALRSLLELGRKDFSNQKYDGYFEQAAEALNKAK